MITFTGEPIVYGVSIPRSAPDSALARRFMEFLLSDDGKRVLRGAKLDALSIPVLVGGGAPESVRALTRFALSGR
jgi:molybdate/tungstate transport system substrate-binding protein